LILSIVFILFFGITFLAPHLNLLDFKNYLQGSQMILKGQSPYGLVEFFAPPWMILLIGVFLLFPTQISSFFWLLICFLSIFGTAVTSINWIKPEASKRLKSLLIFIVVIMPPSLFCYITGQISPLISLAVVFLAIKISKKHVSPWVAFFALLIVTLKPHIGFLPIFICLLELLKQRDWKIFKFIFIGFGVLGVLAFAINPHWLSEMLYAWQSGDFRGGKPGLVSPGYTGFNELGIPSWVFLFFGAYVIYFWWKNGLTYLSLSLAITINLLLIPYCRSYDYIMLIFPSVFLLTKNGKHCHVGKILALLSLLIIPLSPLSILSPVLMSMALIYTSCKTEMKNASNYL